MGHRRAARLQPAPASSYSAATIPSEQYQLSPHQARCSSAEHPPTRAALSCRRPCQRAMQTPAPTASSPIPVRVPTALSTGGQPRAGRDNRSRNHFEVPPLSRQGPVAAQEGTPPAPDRGRGGEHQPGLPGRGLPVCWGGGQCPCSRRCSVTLPPTPPPVCSATWDQGVL